LYKKNIDDCHNTMRYSSLANLSLQYKK